MCLQRSSKRVERKLKVKGVTNQGIVCFVSYGRFSGFCFVFKMSAVFCFLVFVVSTTTSAVDCLERLASSSK